MQTPLLQGETDGSLKGVVTDKGYDGTFMAIHGQTHHGDIICFFPTCFTLAKHTNTVYIYGILVSSCVYSVEK